MKKRLIITLVAGLCTISGGSIRAAESFRHENSNMVYFYLLAFCAAVVFFAVKAVRTVIKHIQRRPKKDMLQSCFDKLLGT